MRQINVKAEKSKYKLKGDDGVYIGELIITYTPKRQTCNIYIIKLGINMNSLSIEANLGVK